MIQIQIQGIEPDGSVNPDEDTSSEKDNDEEENKVKPCPNCGKVHSIKPLIESSWLGPNPFGLLIRFKITKKRKKVRKQIRRKKKEWSKCIISKVSKCIKM